MLYFPLSGSSLSHALFQLVRYVGSCTENRAFSSVYRAFLGWPVLDEVPAQLTISRAYTSASESVMYLS
jgi:hypothetical protein